MTEFELVDLRDYPLPHLDEPIPPSAGTSGVLKSAIDYLSAEWNNKAVWSRPRSARTRCRRGLAHHESRRQADVVGG